MTDDTSLVHVTSTNAPPPPAPPNRAEITRYLDYFCERLKARRDELVKALKDNAQKYPVINDDDTLGMVAENIKMVGDLQRAAEKQRVEHKAPYLEGGRTVDSWFKAWEGPLDLAIAPVQKAMNEYGEREIARQRAAAEAERVAAQAEADRLADLAAAELRKGRAAGAMLDLAGDAAGAADDAEARANARPADLTRTYGTFGAVASAREHWKWRVTDLKKVPRSHLMVDPDKVKLSAKARDASGKPTAVIAGIEWYAETTMGVR